MADFEDSNAPTWDNCLTGQVNLRDAVVGVISYQDPETGKQYALAARRATLMVRPRGWHRWERHVAVGGRAVPAALLGLIMVSQVILQA